MLDYLKPLGMQGGLLRVCPHEELNAIFSHYLQKSFSCPLQNNSKCKLQPLSLQW